MQNHRAKDGCMILRSRYQRTGATASSVSQLTLTLVTVAAHYKRHFSAPLISQPNGFLQVSIFESHFPHVFEVSMLGFFPTNRENRLVFSNSVVNTML